MNHLKTNKMKTITAKLTVVLTVLIMALGFSNCGTAYYGASGDDYYDNYYDNYYDYNPVWAPDYYAGTRYYYFPDIETYYDLATRNFVYLYNGRWLFARALPSFYSNFNLRNAFVVIVDRSMYDPWMHHQYYNSNYPRYYYIDYYDYSNIPYVRAYNENGRRAVYWKNNERNRAREWGDRNIREGRNFKYSNDDRRVQQEVGRRVSQRRTPTPEEVSRLGNADEGRITSRDATPATNQTTTGRATTNRTATERTATPRATTERATTDRTATSRAATERTTTNRTATTQTPARQTAPTTPPTRTSRSEETNYYGGSIGQPVRVERQMRESSGERRTTETRSSTTTTRSTDSGTTTRSTGGSTTTRSTSGGRR